MAGAHGLIIWPDGAEAFAAVEDVGFSKPGKLFIPDVSDGVAETVRVNDFSPDGASRNFRLKPGQSDDVFLFWTEFVDSEAAAQVCSDGGEDVASVEGVVDGVQKVSFVLQPVDALDLFVCEREGQYAVVGADEDVVVGLHSDGFAVAADAGINHCDVHGAPGKITVACHQRERAGADIARRNLVCDVHHRCFGMDAQDHPFHRSNEPILRAEVGG